MSRRVSEDRVGGPRVDCRAPRIGRSRMVESRTEGPGSMHSPGSEEGRRATGLTEPGGMGELVRRLVTPPSERGAGGLTSRMSTNGELPYFVIDEDQKAVGSGTEPPEDPVETRVGQCGWRRRGQRRADAENRAQALGAGLVPTSAEISVWG